MPVCGKPGDTIADTTKFRANAINRGNVRGCPARLGHGHDPLVVAGTGPALRLEALDEAFGLKQFHDVVVRHLGPLGAGMTRLGRHGADRFWVHARRNEAPEAVRHAQFVFDEEMERVVRNRAFLGKVEACT